MLSSKEPDVKLGSSSVDILLKILFFLKTVLQNAPKMDSIFVSFLKYRIYVL